MKTKISIGQIMAEILCQKFSDDLAEEYNKLTSGDREWMKECIESYLISCVGKEGVTD